MLNKAMNVSGGDDEEVVSNMDFNMNSKLSNLKQARILANEITETGAKLYDSLGKENELRESREKALESLDSISRNVGSNTRQEYTKMQQRPCGRPKTTSGTNVRNDRKSEVSRENSRTKSNVELLNSKDPTKG